MTGTPPHKPSPRVGSFGGRLLAMAVVLGGPIVYMVQEHIRWMPDPAAQKRMALKQTGFWGTMVATGVAAHRWILRGSPQSGRFWGTLVLGPLLPPLGYLAGKALGKRLYPKPASAPRQTEVTAPSKMPVAARPRLYPSDAPKIAPYYMGPGYPPRWPSLYY